MSQPDPFRRPRGGLADLPTLEPLPTAAERAADVIREYIFQGKFLPGTALPETTLAQGLQVSRNTVREAFRMLVNEHLLMYEMHKGVAVRWLTPQDVRDIYVLRRMLELAAVDLVRDGRARLDLDALGERVAEGEQAAAEERWSDVGTANLRFHAQIVAAHGSARMDDFFRRLMTEMRLGFLAVPDQKAFYQPYLRRNREILGELAAGRLTEARAALTRYLDEAEQPVVAAVAEAA